MALQHQFAIAAHNDAQARRSRHNSAQNSSGSDHARWPTTKTSQTTVSQHQSSASSSTQDHDELEEIVAEPETSYDWDPAASHDALRDLRNQQLDSLQSILHSIAESLFEHPPASSAATNSVRTLILDDLFASLRRIGGHTAPLSPTFTRSPSTAAGVKPISDIDRLVLLVDRLTLAFGNRTDARQADLLANLATLAQSLVVSERRLSRPALDSPPRTPRTLAAAHRRRSVQSPHSTSHRSASRNSVSSIHSYAALSTSSDEATPTAAASDDPLQPKFGLQPRRAPSPPAKAAHPLETLSAVPEQHHVDGSTFDMATLKRAPASSRSPTNITFSLEALYTPQPFGLGLVKPQSPRSDQASRAASVGDRSDSTALPNRKRYSVQTDSAASTALPSYDSYDAIKKAPHTSDDLPEYDPSSAQASFATDSKKSLDAPTLLERRRAKLAAQHSAYAARTPQDLAMVESSIDRLSTVMPQLDNQRALSPQEQREAQLHHMMARLAQSSSKRMNDQRSNPPSLRASRPAPLPQVSAEMASVVLAKSGEKQRPLPQPDAVGEFPSRGILMDAEPDVPKTPVTPNSVHSSSSSRRGSLLPGAFARKLSIASIGNAIRRASIYDTTKVKPKEVAEHREHDVDASVRGEPNGKATVRRRRAATTHDSRAKSDIADGLASLFNEGKPRKNSAGDVSSASKARSQAVFRAIDFADDTPRGRDSSLMPRASCEEEDDSMLDDYTFAKLDTRTSNHRLSVVPDPPRSPAASWGSGSLSHSSSRRSSQLTTSNPSTPTWPKSPLTPISPVASKRSPTKPTVSFAPDTLQPPPPGRAMAASTQSQLRDNASAYHRPRKCSDFPPCDLARDPLVCAAAAAAACAAASPNDLIVYSVFDAESNKAADTLARLFPSHQSEHVDLEYLVEAQHTLGSISVMLWTASDRELECEYELVDDVLHVAPVGNGMLQLGACEPSVGSGSSDKKRKQGQDHVRSRGVQVRLPAAAVAGQAGRVQLSGAKVSRVKLDLTEAEKRTGWQQSRSEGMVEFPLSASEFVQGGIEGLCCAVCDSGSKLMEMQGVEWRALPSEGWEELVDAWMCHADQELNRSLTETAVRFASKLDTGAEEASARVGKTVWVGDAYMLVPRPLLDEESTVFDEAKVSGVVVFSSKRTGIESRRFPRCSSEFRCNGSSTDTPLLSPRSTSRLGFCLVAPCCALPFCAFSLLLLFVGLLSGFFASAGGWCHYASPSEVAPPSVGLRSVRRFGCFAWVMSTSVDGRGTSFDRRSTEQETEVERGRARPLRAMTKDKWCKRA